MHLYLNGNVEAGRISAYLNHMGNGTPFAVIQLDAQADLHVHTPADCDAIITAAVKAKQLLSPPGAGGVLFNVGDDDEDPWSDEPEDHPDTAGPMYGEAELRRADAYREPPAAAIGTGSVQYSNPYDGPAFTHCGFEWPHESLQAYWVCARPKDHGGRQHQAWSGPGEDAPDAVYDEAETVPVPTGLCGHPVDPGAWAYGWVKCRECLPPEHRAAYDAAVARAASVSA